MSLVVVMCYFMALYFILVTIYNLSWNNFAIYSSQKCAFIVAGLLYRPKIVNWIRYFWNKVSCQNEYNLHIFTRSVRLFKHLCDLSFIWLFCVFIDYFNNFCVWWCINQVTVRRLIVLLVLMVGDMTYHWRQESARQCTGMNQIQVYDAAPGFTVKMVTAV